MIHKIIDGIRHLGHHPTGFDYYLSNLHRHGTVGGPTIDEAKKDYRSTMHSENSGLLR